MAFAAFACSDNDPAAPPTLDTITVTVPAASLMTGQTSTATAAGVDQHGDSIAVGTVTWSSSATNVATVNATTGLVTAVAPGTADITATAGSKSGKKTVTVAAPAGIKVNEVESSGGTPGDWIELYNPTAAAVDIGGWVLKDNDDTHIYTIPTGTSIAANGYFVAEEAALGYGLGAPDSARLYNPYGVQVDAYGWTAHAATTYGRCPNATGAFATTTSVTKGAANDCSVNVKINEVESSGGTPGDWIELYNAGGAPADISGYILKDNDDTHSFAIPAGTTIAAGAAMAFDVEAAFGLGAADAARLFTPTGTLVDSYSWTAHAATTYGRCPDGTGAFTTNAVSTKGALNACGGTTAVAWPGPGTDVATVDLLGTFTENLSGLMYEAGSTNVIWAVVNGGPSKLHRLVWDGTTWNPDAANSWSTGKALHYTDGTGQPDAEGVTYAGTGSTGGIYVSTERNNDANSINRFSILRYDASAAGTELTATREWNLTTDLPTPSAVNLGLEGIAWVPDSYLTANHLYDSAAHHEYTPSDYADHAGGLFLVGLEANGIIYAYALNHTTGGYTRVTSFSMGQTSVMEVSFDRDNQVLWAYCDNGCGNKATTLSIDASSASPTYGQFVVTRVYSPPSSLPVTMNNEGFTFEPESACVAGQKYVFWSDDGDTGGYSLRRAKINCGIH